MGLFEAPTVSHHKKADFLMEGFFSLWMRSLFFFWGSTSLFRLDFHYFPFPGVFSFNLRNNVG